VSSSRALDSSWNTTGKFEFAVLSVTVTSAAVPLVSWLPAVLTPGRLMLAVPLNDTPPIVRAVSSAVAVPALPEVSWLPEVFTPGRLMLAVPSNDTPPIVLAVSSAVAVQHYQ